ncbi:DMT family transporter [Pseudoalteromonas fenneropenaei]|uniref:DMT family transporter n=1 Tax=Pseudoalteromonas fenneropenaei TaxID=1737459 RepID=A0ABV7CPU9_9GAMM
MKTVNTYIQTIGFTITALVAFAANSVLCRIALKDDFIDASSFTAVRLLSGVLVFLVLLSFKRKPLASNGKRKAGSWKAALMLFVYAIAFSYAYVSLDTGTGALVLFGAVQLTMIATSVLKGKRLHLAEWLGVLISFSGLAYLVYPTLTTPSLSGFMLMGLSGIAWGMYTSFGRGSIDPMRDTASNFKYTVPFVAVLVLVTFPAMNISLYGVVLAVISGAFASALGYTIWYSALAGLSEIEAAVVQLSVPVIAAIGGVLFVAEAISMRLVLACILVLGGIFMVLISRWKSAKR